MGIGLSYPYVQILSSIGPVILMLKLIIQEDIQTPLSIINVQGKLSTRSLPCNHNPILCICQSAYIVINFVTGVSGYEYYWNRSVVFTPKIFNPENQFYSVLSITH